MAKVLAIPDLHAPYTNLKALTLLYKHIELIKPTHIVCLGDQLDLYAFSKFPRSHNVMTPKQELEQGIGLLREMWEIIQRISPQSINYQLLGNHMERLPKRILDRLPEAESLFRVEDLVKFNGVHTIIDDRLVIDDVLYLHGFLTKPYAHMRYFLKSCVFGHTHNAWLLYEKIHEKQLFEFTSGYLADDSQIPLKYTAAKINKWSTGFGLIDEGVPCFIPL